MATRISTRAEETQRQLGGFNAITKLIQDLTANETARQNKNQLLEFVKLTAKGLSPEEAAAQVVSAEPRFDPGLAGVFQRFGAGGAQPNILTSAITSEILNRPSGFEQEQAEARLESTKALTEQRKRGKVVDSGKERDKLVAIIQKTKDKSPIRANRARTELLSLPEGTLFDLSLAEDEDIDTELTAIFKKEELKSLKIKRPGDLIDKVFGEEAYLEGLAQATKQALDEGGDPKTVKAIFNKWWDEQAEKVNFAGFREFQLRSEFEKATDITTPDIPERTLTKTVLRNPGESINDFLKRTGQ